MAVSAILNLGKFSIFDLDDIEGRVIPLFKGFPFLKIYFGYSVNVKSEVKSQIYLYNL